MRDFGEIALRLRVPQIGHEAATGYRAVDFVTGGEQRIVNGERRATVFLALRFGDAAAKIIQQVEKFRFLASLRRVVRAPILRIRFARLAHGKRLSDGCRAVWIAFTLKNVLDCENMLALVGAILMVRATAM